MTRIIETIQRRRRRTERRGTCPERDGHFEPRFHYERASLQTHDGAHGHAKGDVQDEEGESDSTWRVGLCHDGLYLPSVDYLFDKVIASLICFTVILALSNLGTSFASAILAKDATVSNGALTNKKGETLATNTEADTFPAATYYSGNEASRERVRRLCQDADGDGDFDGDFMERADGSTVWMKYHACEDEIHDGTLYLSREDGIALIERCRIERRVQIKRVWDHDASIQTMIQICPHDRGTYTAPGAEHPEVTWGGNDDTRIGPAPDTNGAIYSLWGNRFTSDLGQPCDEDADCDTRQNLSCVENTCSTG